MSSRFFFHFFIIFLCIPHSAVSISKDYLALLLPDNPIIVDAGAYDGTDTFEMSQKWPKGMIYAFEPVPNYFQRLTMNTLHCHNVVCIQKALSNKIGYFPMYISASSNGLGAEQASSLLKPEMILIESGIIFPEEIVVEAVTLDAFAESMNIDHIDMLWFDLQGAEQLVLQASPKILKTVKVVYAEVSYISLYVDSPLYPEFKAWMEDQGFEVLLEEKLYHSFGNVLFIRKS